MTEFTPIYEPVLNCIKSSALRRAALWDEVKDRLNDSALGLSGGQMQRLMIARIFLLKPKILLADEPTSMIDACSRATILDELMQLRNEIGMTVIFITHDIGLAYCVSDNVYIMQKGKFVESGSADEVGPEAGRVGRAPRAGRPGGAPRRGGHRQPGRHVDG